MGMKLQSKEVPCFLICRRKGIKFKGKSGSKVKGIDLSHSYESVANVVLDDDHKDVFYLGLIFLLD